MSMLTSEICEDKYLLDPEFEARFSIVVAACKTCTASGALQQCYDGNCLSSVTIGDSLSVSFTCERIGWPTRARLRSYKPARTLLHKVKVHRERDRLIGRVETHIPSEVVSTLTRDTVVGNFFKCVPLAWRPSR